MKEKGRREVEGGGRRDGEKGREGGRSSSKSVLAYVKIMWPMNSRHMLGSSTVEANKGSIRGPLNSQHRMGSYRV